MSADRTKLLEAIAHAAVVRLANAGGEVGLQGDKRWATGTDSMFEVAFDGLALTGSEAVRLGKNLTLGSFEAAGEPLELGSKLQMLVGGVVLQGELLGLLAAQGELERVEDLLKLWLTGEHDARERTLEYLNGS